MNTKARKGNCIETAAKKHSRICVSGHGLEKGNPRRVCCKKLISVRNVGRRRMQYNDNCKVCTFGVVVVWREVSCSILLLEEVNGFKLPVKV